MLSDEMRGDGTMVSPSKKLEDLIHLAELCVDLLQQNEEHYAEVIFFIYIHLNDMFRKLFYKVSETNCKLQTN